MGKIEIFKPFGEGYTLMKKILFQPFDLTKWLTIGFAAFLSGQFAAGSFNPNLSMRNHRAAPPSPPVALTNFFQHWKPWLPLIIIIAVAIFLVLLLLLFWLRARGQFIFTDCIVRDRGAIAEPWREYRAEANSFFRFSLALTFGAMALFGTSAAIFIPIFSLSGTHGSGTIILAAVFALFFLAWIALWIFLMIVLALMPFAMYAQRCLALDAFRSVTRLIADHPWPLFLFCGFGFVLVLAMLMVGTVVTCVTCCVAALPYVGTVLMLPVFVWLRAFALFFLRQFGTDYDVFARSTSSPPAPPPLSA